MNDPKIKVLACGGTIDKVYFDAKSDYEVGEPQILTILRESNVSINYDIESIVRKDSLEMDDKDRSEICRAVEASDSKRILITHGTDTMIETAKRLDDIPGRTIVLTGAMEPARFRDTDAVFNIGCAVAAVQTLPPGVYIVMNGRVFDPHKTRKNVADGVFEEVS
jgi:L-asparaginase